MGVWECGGLDVILFHKSTSSYLHRFIKIVPHVRYRLRTCYGIRTCYSVSRSANSVRSVR